MLIDAAPAPQAQGQQGVAVCYHSVTGARIACGTGVTVGDAIQGFSQGDPNALGGIFSNIGGILGRW